MTDVNDNVQRRIDALAGELVERGDLRSPEWRQAFLAVRRHVFVPRYWHDDEPGAFPARWRMVDKATRDHREWLEAVYSNRTLATDLSGTPAVCGDGMHPQVTSSTTMPGLVMAMLEELDVAEGMSVLEIGTGAGYNAALLCERLGDTQVTSIDIDPELVALARVRLDRHGFRPCIVAGNGACGVPERAPYDRIIATCGVESIPHAWIDQTRECGKILANIRGPFNAFALTLLTVTDGAASGPFIRQSGGFMPLRTNPLLPYDYAVTIDRRSSDTTERYSPLDPREIYSDDTLGLLAQTHLSGVLCRQIYVDENENIGTEFSTPDGLSWAVAHHRPHNESHYTIQSGPRRLWGELEQLYSQWDDLHRPPFDRFGLTVHGRSHNLWLDHPDAIFAIARSG